MSPRKIDSHHHFWIFNAAEYPWIGDSLSGLRRDFLPEDLNREITSAGIDGAVAVQARQTVTETEWLLELARAHDFLAGVVGWVPLADSGVGAILEKLTPDGKLKGVRHNLQDEADDSYMLRDDFNRGVGTLVRYGLVYDILIYERHLKQTIDFVDRHPEQKFVLDHIAKPRIRDRILSPWRERLGELARRENVWCKLSGVVTEADHQHWTEADLAPYIETALEAFGPERLMFGSDWPVCLAATTYSDWVNVAGRAIQGLTSSEQARVFGLNAIEAYNLR